MMHSLIFQPVAASGCGLGVRPQVTGSWVRPGLWNSYETPVITQSSCSNGFARFIRTNVHISGIKHHIFHQENVATNYGLVATLPHN